MTERKKLRKKDTVEIIGIHCGCGEIGEVNGTSKHKRDRNRVFYEIETDNSRYYCERKYLKLLTKKKK
tara:strand:- start:205 stop:408 length:204 start_codon:yes stop_codon:yes gene_type:complete